MKIIKGGVTAPLGYRASGISCGIKKHGKKDLALIFSVIPAVSCGLFTANKVKSASVLLSERRLANNRAQAILVNSGNANCLVGAAGLADAARLTGELARGLNIAEDDALFASTGIIGRRLPMKKAAPKIPLIIEKLSRRGSRDAALAIMTTDTCPKEIAVEFSVGKKALRIGGMAKGAGMISPRLIAHATMLSFVTTDAAVAPNILKRAAACSAERSFDRITVDGDMSTNDTVIVMANGLAGNRRIKSKGREFEIFSAALSFVMERLAKMIVEDGEGATKVIEIEVRNAKSSADAEKVARSAANSSLVKTAIYGSDPNWGRIAAAAGAAGASFDARRLGIAMGGKPVLRNGSPVRAEGKTLKRAVSGKEIKITIDLKAGKKDAQVWTCDLSEKYVRINAKYETK